MRQSEHGHVRRNVPHSRPALTLDLTALPRRYRFFEVQSDSCTADRYAIEFLHSFVKSLAAKIERVDREHVDYAACCGGRRYRAIMSAALG
jgi:hypothetical protein